MDYLFCILFDSDFSSLTQSGSCTVHPTINHCPTPIIHLHPSPLFIQPSPPYQPSFRFMKYSTQPLSFTLLTVICLFIYCTEKQTHFTKAVRALGHPAESSTLHLVICNVMILCLKSSLQIPIYHLKNADIYCDKLMVGKKLKMHGVAV